MYICIPSTSDAIFLALILNIKQFIYSLHICKSFLSLDYCWRFLYALVNSLQQNTFLFFSLILNSKSHVQLAPFMVAQIPLLKTLNNFLLHRISCALFFQEAEQMPLYNMRQVQISTINTIPLDLYSDAEFFFFFSWKD